jgi:hypothetical protein
VALGATASLCFLASPASWAEVAQKGGLRVAVSGKLTPHKLPRAGKVPVVVSFAGRITSTDGSEPPQLLSIELAINRHGTLTYRGIPKCRMGHINPSTTAEAISEAARAAASIPGSRPGPSTRSGAPPLPSCSN